MLKINVIGAGLAGSECALYLANKGYFVNLYDIKEKAMSPAHHSKDYAEIVCSNSFKSDDENTASGLFKRELILLGSELIIHSVLDDTKFCYKVSAKADIKPHSKVSLGFETDELRFFDLDTEVGIY